ncbi:MAG: hypothetical protein ACXVXC_14110 [Nocardioidaceae bacterium]
MSALRRGATVLLACAALLVPSGCGQDQGDPGVDEALTQVDAAIAAGHLADARRQLDDLVRETAAARAAGTISDGHAQAIEAAAARLAVRLPMPGSGSG